MSSGKHFDIVDIVYATFRPFDELWTDTDKRRWVTMTDKNLDEMTSIVKDAICDQSRPKNIICLIFQKVVGGMDNAVMRDYVNEIVETTKGQKWNKCSIGTCWFVPSHMQVWSRVGAFNKIAHEANESMGMPRLNTHRAVMTMVLGDGSDKTLRVRFGMWIEPQLGLHFGSNLSFEGVAKVVDTVNKTFDHAFKFRKSLPRPSRETRVMVPPCLSVTAGYNKNQFMRHLLADRGVIERDQGVKRQLMSDQRMPGWQNWHVYKTHGPLHRFNEREGMLAAHKLLLQRNDEIPIWHPEDDTESEYEEPVQAPDDDVPKLRKPCKFGEAYDPEAYDPEEWVADTDLEIEINNQPDLEIEIDNKSEGETEVVTRKVLLVDSDDEEMVQLFGAEPSKEEGRKYNEDLDYVKELQLAERKITIAVEKAKAYKAELERKNLIITKEKAAVKFWKQQSDQKKDRCNFLEAEYERILAQYKYLKNVYKARGAKDLN